MKFIRKSDVPASFEAYAASEPDESWNNFCRDKPGIYGDLRSKLLQDQRGICAYCEIDLIVSEGIGYSDFRIEHFHPKSDNHPEWTFRWDNLLGVCCGGNRDHLAGTPPDRFTSPDHSCDVPKGEKNLDGVIFNPVRDAELISDIFEFSNDGTMSVSTRCPDALVEIAKRTIRELQLSSAMSRTSTLRLTRLRAALIDALEQQVGKLMEGGFQIDEALAEIAQAFFSADAEVPWPKFFSCVRWYLGTAAEDRLAEIGYIG